MSIWILSSIVFCALLTLAVVILWIRQMRPPKEDPRLSRGLQLLQSKIAVLEDLSDRTEIQVKQLTQILDEKAKGLQTKMLKAEETIIKIEQSMQKSLNVAEIFQDKIPHEEIIERNQQTKYVQAAKLANEGLTVDEIIQQVDLPRNEVEFIAKVNRDELTFDPNLLPEWAKPRGQNHEREAEIVSRVFHAPARDLSSLQQIEADFKKTVREVEELERQEAERVRQAEARAQALKQQAAHVTQGILHSAGEILKTSGDAIKTSAHQVAKTAVTQAKPVIRKVQFPRIHVDKT